ncbi:hypothetical protein KFE25_000483 [Diacronema lutheri]|uniref:Uncharacterized protein n=1 Tax=Diacronema lutheri TaxID=2081491 RepID=A0A8J6CA35_DIALT|nr:hypothetical protein KFE25_000483 [Diacronema lutheri]
MAASGKAYNMFNVQEAEFWKQRVERENLHASLRSMPALSDVGSALGSKVSGASSSTRSKIEHLETMLHEERSKRKALERKLDALERIVANPL